MSLAGLALSPLSQRQLPRQDVEEWYTLQIGCNWYIYIGTTISFGNLHCRKDVILRYQQMVSYCKILALFPGAFDREWSVRASWRKQRKGWLIEHVFSSLLITAQNSTTCVEEDAYKLAQIQMCVCGVIYQFYIIFVCVDVCRSY